MRRTAKIFFLIVAAAPVIAGAQKETADDGSVDETIDEITVFSGRTLGQMRSEIARAEDEVYAIFNDLNTDDRYDIICKKETRLGSQIVRRVCLSRMYRDALSDATEDAAEDAANGASVGVGTVGANISSRKHQQILREKMRSLASENQELLAALKKRHKLVREFEERRAEKYEQ